MINKDFFNDLPQTSMIEEKSEIDLDSNAMYPPKVDFFSKDTPENSKNLEVKESEELEVAADEAEDLDSGIEEKSNKPVKSEKSQKFKVIIDGKEEEVELQELLNSYSGKKVVDRKFSELDKEKQQYKKDLDSVNAYISEFAAKSKKSPLEAFEYLAGSVGMDTLEFRKNMKGEFLKQYAAYANMDENQRRLHDIEEENNYYRSIKKSEHENAIKEREVAELNNSVKQMQTDHKISDERLEELISDLKTHGKKSDVTIKDVIELHAAYERQDRAIAVLGAVDKELLKDDSKIIALESLLAGNSKLSDDDLKNYAEKLWLPEKKAIEVLSKKVKSPTKEKPGSSKKSDNIISKKMVGGGLVDFFK